MTTFYRFGPSFCQPLGLGIACGALLGTAILAGTTKRHSFITTNDRKSTAPGLSSWLNSSRFSSRSILGTIRQYGRLFGKLANGSRKATLTTTVPLPSVEDSLLFQGATFGEPERANLHELSMHSSSPLSMLQPLYSPRKSLLFQGSIFDRLTPRAPISFAHLPLPPVTPLQLSSSDYMSSAGHAGWPTEADFRPADDSMTPDGFLSNLPLVMGEDQLFSSGAIASVLSSKPDRQDVPAIIHGFGATLTIGGGSVRDHLATALAGLEQQATNERLSLTLLVEFKGNVSSATRIIRDIMNSTKEYLECLAIYMPNEDHHHPSSIHGVRLTQPPVSPTETSVLRHLVWKGNVLSDLFAQWGSASNISFGTLHTLNLTCGLSIEDCIQILFQCEKMVEFSAQSVGEFMSVMKHDYYNKEIPQLGSLAIKSSVPMHQMFSTLHLRKLKSIDLDLGPAAIALQGVSNLDIPWTTVQHVRVVGILHKFESDKLVEQCSNAVHHHQMLDGTILLRRPDLETTYA